MRSLDEIKQEIERLKNAIRKHRDTRADNRCWLDDQELYAVLYEDVPTAQEVALPPKECFLMSCERFWNRRQNPLSRGTALLPDGMTIAQLTEALEARRTPGPATKLVLERFAATASMFKPEHCHPNAGFGANINFTVDEMRDCIAEWEGE